MQLTNISRDVVEDVRNNRSYISYNFESKANWVGAIFGGIALTAITYFILMKGIKGTTYAKDSLDIIGNMTIKDYLEANVISIIAYSSVFWSLLSYFFYNCYKSKHL